MSAHMTHFKLLKSIKAVN
uniref:Uncharacterized protein n=1 Tax=Anguilla anguilla TaxID=7936 RepID=A0A0E9V6Y3_ANGAN